MGMAYPTGGQTKLQLDLWTGNIMKCCVHTVGKIFPLSEIEIVTPMSASHRLTHRF